MFFIDGFVFFFFQAEDGIRDRNVTGVQTCALPILKSRGRGRGGGRVAPGRRLQARGRRLYERQPLQTVRQRRGDLRVARLELVPVRLPPGLLGGGILLQGLDQARVVRPRHGRRRRG